MELRTNNAAVSFGAKFGSQKIDPHKSLTYDQMDAQEMDVKDSFDHIINHQLDFDLSIILPELIKVVSRKLPFLSIREGDHLILNYEVMDNKTSEKNGTFIDLNLKPKDDNDGLLVVGIKARDTKDSPYWVSGYKKYELEETTPKSTHLQFNVNYVISLIKELAGIGKQIEGKK